MSPEYAKEISSLLQFPLVGFSEYISDKVPHRHTTASSSATINSAIEMVLVQVEILSGSTFSNLNNGAHSISLERECFGPAVRIEILECCLV